MESVKTPKCPYCGENTITLFREEPDNSISITWFCNCNKIKALQYQAIIEGESGWIKDE